MTEKQHNSGADQTSDEVTVETTSVFRADFLNELDAPAAAGTEGAVSGVEGLPAGSALLVVKRVEAILRDRRGSGGRERARDNVQSAGRRIDHGRAKNADFGPDIRIGQFRNIEHRRRNGRHKIYSPEGRGRRIGIESVNGIAHRRDKDDVVAGAADGKRGHIKRLRIYLAIDRKREEFAK